MIQMLSRFDLKPDTDLSAFSDSYFEFFERMKEKGFAEATGKIGKRISDTPMDTDAEDAQQYYVIMSFRDREQLDQAYAYMDQNIVPVEEDAPHANVMRIVHNFVFTCWQE